ncbi:MAG: polysaccharide pyruvyl transferase CsaB [Negativicutes bacterium]|mgnify:FL=1|jgi:polysaccharide pyruvyl transferase CsaB|nr:polysaccharide pyruvyl transferase CsaB [Negativicutes bacterium]MBP9537535.1 polysaccharide pyruvyl transferase CsaB [Negativicutes bacterium]MBP9949742.1 polysaccharide pyruvyl transferase CsaB [Negativicutes bacterium]
MSKIVISGYYGFKNAGDEAMLAAMIEVLSKLDDSLHITVISGDPQDTIKRHGVRAVYWLNYYDIAKAIKNSDLVISGGGSLLQDVTSARSLYYYISIMVLGKMLGKPVMLYAQGIGPITGKRAKQIMKLMGNKVDLITVRDEGSVEELAELGITKTPIYCTADAVLAIEKVDKTVGQKILAKYNILNEPVIGISVREWYEWDHYKEVLAKVADEINVQLGAKVVFIPMQYPEDVKAAEKIAQKMQKDVIILNEEYNTSELLSIVGNLDLLMGIRLHALIFAGVMGVPMIGISYDPKIDRFLESIGEESTGCLLSLKPDKVIEQIKLKWQEKQTEKKDEVLLQKLKKAAFSNAELALGLINKQLK